MTWICFWPEKHAATTCNHRKDFSLEPEFWEINVSVNMDAHYSITIISANTLQWHRTLEACVNTFTSINSSSSLCCCNRWPRHQTDRMLISTIPSSHSPFTSYASTSLSCNQESRGKWFRLALPWKPVILSFLSLNNVWSYIWSLYYKIQMLSWGFEIWN